MVNPAGRVITAAAVHSTVVLERSTGPTTATTTTTVATTGTTTTTVASQNLVAVPNVVGMDEAQVRAAMTTADLYYSTVGPGAGTEPDVDQGRLGGSRSPGRW